MGEQTNLRQGVTSFLCGEIILRIADIYMTLTRGNVEKLLKSKISKNILNYALNFKKELR